MATSRTGSNNVEETRDALMADVKSGLDQVEALLREAATASGDKATELRESALEGLRRASDVLVDAQDSVMRRGRAAARATDDYVHDNPWRSLAVALAAGLVVGLLARSRR
ncbi:MAG: DUF883 family protein [Pigmentiphaga sp.]|nr:DUF883 family protein [Pigmentiphaga sp.]